MTDHIPIRAGGEEALCVACRFCGMPGEDHRKDFECIAALRAWRERALGLLRAADVCAGDGMYVSWLRGLIHDFLSSSPAG
jgi:hypothetical protein